MQYIPAILALVASTVAAAVGAIVWQGERSNPYRRSFLFLAVLVCFWVLSNVIFSLGGEGLRYPVALLSYGLALLMAAQLFLFCFMFAYQRASGKLGLIVILFGLISAVVSMIPGVIAYGIDGRSIQTHFLPFAVYSLVLIGFLVAASVVLLVARKRSGKKMRQRIDVIVAGLGTSAVIGSVCNLFLPLFLGSYVFVLLGPASAVLFVGAIAYAIIKHGLFDVRLAVVRSSAYFLVLTTMVATYFVLAFIVSGLLRRSFATPIELVTNVTIAIALALLFQPLRQFFDRLTNHLFYRDNYDTDEFFARLSEELTVASDLRGLLERSSVVIGETFKSEFAFFSVRYETHYLKAGFGHHGEVQPREVKDLDQYIVAQGQGIVLTEALDEKSSAYHWLAKHKIRITMPLARGGVIIGYLFLGERRSRDYTQRDIRALETVSNELVIATQNALSVQEVKDINDTLQQRIDEATSELRANNALLQRLDEAKDEFISMASHQLRTPLTSVKGYISMVLEGDAGKISEPQRHLLDEAFASSERMVHLINDFLNVSRLQTGKFMLEQRPIDLAKITKQEVEGLRNIARVHGLKLEYRSPSRFPLLYIDESKVRQVIMNFIDNAIYYSHEGTTIKVELGIADGSAVLEVHDTGIGVPAKEQSHLFSKFFRATNARRQRPDGTGVGLFLSKKVIAAHGGDMVFQSTEGKGSTFGFRLPVKKLSVAPEDTK